MKSFKRKAQTISVGKTHKKQKAWEQLLHLRELNLCKHFELVVMQAEEAEDKEEEEKKYKPSVLVS